MLPIFSLVVVVVLIIAMTMVYLYNQSAMEKFNSINAVYVPVKNALAEVHSHTVLIQDVFKEVATLKDQELLEDLPEHAEHVRRNIQIIVEAIPDPVRVHGFRKVFDDYYHSGFRLSEKMIEISMAGLMTEISEVNIYREHFEEHLSRVEENIESIYQKSVTSSQAQMQKLTWIVFSTVFILISVLTLGSFVIMRKLSSRLSVLTGFAKDIQMGHYEKSVDENWNDEFSIVVDAMNSMAKSIKYSTEKLHRLANYDGLTEVYSRTAIMGQLEAAVQSVLRHKYSLCFCMCDVDNFKQVNDQYGHEMGDKVLETFADYLKTVLRTEDIIGRYGGDEFSIIFPHTTADTAVVALERVKSCLSDHVFCDHSGQQFSITCSFGVAEFHEDMDKTLFMRTADEALYMSKENGRNSISIKRWSPDILYSGPDKSE